MSVSTHLEILTTLEAWAQGHEDTLALLHKALPFLRESVTSAEHLTLFRLEGHTLIAGATTHPDTTETPKVHATHSQALTLRKPIFDDGRACWIVPMNLGPTPYGLLEITSRAPHQPLDESAQAWVMLIAAIMAQALDRRTLRAPMPQATADDADERRTATAARQRAASTELTSADDLAQMAQVLERHFLNDTPRFLSLYQLENSGTDAAKAWHLIHAAHPYNAEALAWNDLGEALRSRLLNGESTAPASLNAMPMAQIGERFYRWLNTHNLKSFAALPIASGGHTTGVLLISGKDTALLTPDELIAFEALAAQIGAVSDVHHTAEQARGKLDTALNIAQATQAIAATAAYPQMVQILMERLGRGLCGAALTLFDRPTVAGETPASRRIVGLASDSAIIDVNTSTARADSFSEEQLKALREDGGLKIARLEAASFSTETNADYAAVGAGALVSFGLRAGDKLIGTLDLLTRNAPSLDAEYAAVYAALANQIGLNAHARQLLGETQAAQTLAAQLVETNSRIAMAEDYAEMTAAVMDALPTSIDAAALLLFDEPITTREMPRHLRMEALAARDSVAQLKIADTLSPDDVATVRAIKTLLDGVTLFIDDTTERKDNPMPSISQALAERGLHSLAAVPLRTGARVLGALCFLAADTHLVRALQDENLRAIAGQVSIAIENRNLLNQTADALSFVAAQYEMSSALFRAQSNRELLSTLYRFTDGAFDKAALGLVDLETRRVRVVAQIERGETVSGERDDQTLYDYTLPESVDTSEVITSADGRTLTLPLFNREREITALVTFNSRTPVELPFNQVRALRSLADQMAIILENRFLLLQTDRNLIETRVLYEMNQSLLGTQDGLDVLNVIRRTIAQSAHTLAVADIEYDSREDTLNDFVIYAMLSPDSASRERVALYRNEDFPLYEAFLRRWETQGDQVLFIERIEDRVSEPILKHLREQGTVLQSAVFVPVQEENRIKQQIMIGFQTPMRFTERDRRLYTALRDQVRVVLENQRLLRDISATAAQLGNQVRVLQALNQLGANIGVAQTETDLMNEAAQALVAALRCDHVGITLLNPDGKSSTVMGEYPDMGLAGVVIEGENEFQRQIMLTRAPIYVAEVKNDERLAPAAREGMMSVGIQSCTFYPMLDVSGRYLGSVGIDSHKPHFELSPQMYEVTRTITAQIMMTLRNIRQLRNTQRQAAQLQELALLNQNIQTELEAETILKTGVETLPRILEADHIAVYVMSGESQPPELLFTKVGEALEKHSNRSLKATEQTSLGAVIKGRDMIALSDANLGDTRFTLDAEPRSVLASPLFARGVIVGVIEIATARAYAYEDTDAVVFRQFATQLSIALENAQAYNQSQRVARSKALVNEISSQMQQQQEFEDVLNVTIEQLGRALGARKGRIRLGKADQNK